MLSAVQIVRSSLISYTSQIKYLRRHCLTCLLCCSPVPVDLFLHKEKRVVLLCLEETGLSKKERQLTLTGSHRPNFVDSFQAGVYLDQAKEALSMITLCLYLLRQCFKLVAKQLDGIP